MNERRNLCRRPSYHNAVCCERQQENNTVTCTHSPAPKIFAFHMWTLRSSRYRSIVWNHRRAGLWHSKIFSVSSGVGRKKSQKVTESEKIGERWSDDNSKLTSQRGGKIVIASTSHKTYTHAHTSTTQKEMCWGQKTFLRQMKNSRCRRSQNCHGGFLRCAGLGGDDLRKGVARSHVRPGVDAEKQSQKQLREKIAVGSRLSRLWLALGLSSFSENDWARKCPWVCHLKETLKFALSWNGFGAKIDSELIPINPNCGPFVHDLVSTRDYRVGLV